jgi:hypothetical protein
MVTNFETFRMLREQHELAALAKAAKDACVDCGYLFQHNQDKKRLFLVSDDSTEEEDVQALIAQAKGLGYDMDVESECYPAEDAWSEVKAG